MIFCCMLREPGQIHPNLFLWLRTLQFHFGPQIQFQLSFGSPAFFPTKVGPARRGYMYQFGVGVELESPGMMDPRMGDTFFTGPFFWDVFFFWQILISFFCFGKKFRVNTYLFEGLWWIEDELPQGSPLNNAHSINSWPFDHLVGDTELPGWWFFFTDWDPLGWNSPNYRVETGGNDDPICLFLGDVYTFLCCWYFWVKKSLMEDDATWMKRQVGFQMGWSHQRG